MFGRGAEGVPPHTNQAATVTHKTIVIGLTGRVKGLGPEAARAQA